MTTCYECGSDVIYPNDAFDVISKCSNKDCKTHKEKKNCLSTTTWIWFFFSWGAENVTW